MTLIANSRDQRRYLTFQGQIIELRRDDRNLWVDPFGTVYAYAESDSVTDPVDACGVWPFRFPPGSPLDPGCKVHDFMYSSPAYQFFNTRAEADAYMLGLHTKATKQSWFKVFARPFHFIARWIGGRYWENEKTR